MFKIIISICILTYLIFNFSSNPTIHNKNIFDCMGCDVEYGWPWVYQIQYSGDSLRGARTSNEVFDRNAYIADIIVAIIVSVLIVFFISFIFKIIKKRKSVQ